MQEDLVIDQAFEIRIRVRVIAPQIRDWRSQSPTTKQDPDWPWLGDILERQRRLLEVLARNPQAIGSFIKSWLLCSLAQSNNHPDDNHALCALIHPEGEDELVSSVMDQLDPEDAAEFQAEIDNDQLTSYTDGMWEGAVVILDETTISEAP